MTTAPNPYRGEVRFELAGVSYVGRPDYTAIVLWEELTGRTTTDLLMRFASGAFTARELASVIGAAIQSGGVNVKVEQVGRWIVEGGQTEYLGTAGRLLKNALTGGRDAPAGEVEAPDAGTIESRSGA